MINTLAIKKKFMGANKKSYGVMDSMILAGIPIAICYWFLESILQIFFSGKYNFIAVSSDRIFTKSIRGSLFCAFSSYSARMPKMSSIKSEKPGKNSMKARKSTGQWLTSLTIGSIGSVKKVILSMFPHHVNEYPGIARMPF